MVASIKIARSALSLTALDGKLYAMGGFDGNNFLSIVEVYDPKLNEWVEGTPLTSGRSGHASAVIYQPSCAQTFMDCNDVTFDDPNKRLPRPPDDDDDDNQSSHNNRNCHSRYLISDMSYLNPSIGGERCKKCEEKECNDIGENIDVNNDNQNNGMISIKICNSNKFKKVNNHSVNGDNVDDNNNNDDETKKFVSDKMTEKFHNIRFNVNSSQNYIRKINGLDTRPCKERNSNSLLLNFRRNINENSDNCVIDNDVNVDTDNVEDGENLKKSFEEINQKQQHKHIINTELDCSDKNNLKVHNNCKCSLKDFKNTINRNINGFVTNFTRIKRKKCKFSI